MQAQVLYWFNFKNTRDSVLIFSPYVFYNIYRHTRSSNGKQNAQINLINTKPNCRNARSFHRERAALSPTSTHMHTQSSAKGMQRAFTPTSHGLTWGLWREGEKYPQPTKNPTTNHHTTIHALHTGLKTCPIVDTCGWNTSSANIEVEWLKKLASYVEYILVFFNLAFATCPFGVLSMGMGTGWLLQLSQAQGSALPLPPLRGTGHHAVPSPLTAAKQKPPWTGITSCCSSVASKILNA